MEFWDKSKFLNFKSLFVFFERERERERERKPAPASRRRGSREGERESQAGSTFNVEPDSGLDPMNREITT